MKKKKKKYFNIFPNKLYSNSLDSNQSNWLSQNFGKMTTFDYMAIKNSDKTLEVASDLENYLKCNYFYSKEKTRKKKA